MATARVRALTFIEGGVYNNCRFEILQLKEVAVRLLLHRRNSRLPHQLSVMLQPQNVTHHITPLRFLLSHKHASLQVSGYPEMAEEFL